MERNERKEQEKEEWKDSVREHLKHQEEWNKHVSDQLIELKQQIVMLNSSNSSTARIME